MQARNQEEAGTTGNPGKKDSAIESKPKKGATFKDPRKKKGATPVPVMNPTHVVASPGLVHPALLVPGHGHGRRRHRRR